MVVGKATRVYVFKKGQMPYRSSTEGVAAQRDFYSAPSDEESLDDKITTYEGIVLAPAIEALREAPAGPIDSQLAAAAVVHLSIRSAFVRDSWSAAASEMLDYLADAMRSYSTARALLDVDTLNAESALVKRIAEELASSFAALPEGNRNALAKLAHFRVRETLPQVLPDLSVLAWRPLRMLLEKIPEITVSGHSKALEKDLIPASRVERLKAMNWQIMVAAPQTHFVLPDCLAVGSKTLSFQNIEPYSLQNDDELACVVMPVCHNKVLVGSFGNPEVNMDSLNRSFAQCSLDFFISSQADTQTTEVAQLIGSTVSTCIDELLKNEVFAAPARRDSNDESLDKKSNEREQVKVPIKFEPPCRKSGKAQATVRNLMDLPELQVGLRIVKTIVVTDNIVHSLHQRGEKLNGCAAQAVRWGACYLTETPAGVSCQLFLTTASVNLVAKGHPLARSAAAMIRHQAGRATYYATVFTKIPIQTLQHQRPLLEAVGLRIANFFCSHYFGGRLSGLGHVSDEDFAITDALYSEALPIYMQRITSARLHFIEYRDVDAALDQALGHVEQLLCAVATACASTSGEVDRWRSSKSLECLKGASLGHWFELFALDLERFFNSRERLNGDNDLVLLGSHIERVLWSFGIVLSTHSPGQIRMDVLSDEQLQHILLMLRT